MFPLTNQFLKCKGKNMCMSKCTVKSILAKILFLVEKTGNSENCVPNIHLLM